MKLWELFLSGQVYDLKKEGDSFFVWVFGAFCGSLTFIQKLRNLKNKKKL